MSNRRVFFLTCWLDLLEQISAFIEFVHPDIPAGQPHPCVNFVNELWPIFDLCIKNFGDSNVICEPLGRCLKSCIKSYKLHFLPLLPQLLDRLVIGFEQSGLGVYLYVSLKVIEEYAQSTAETTAVCFSLIERLSGTMFTKANTTNFNDIPDGKDKEKK